MATNKNALIRYKILDKCFRNNGKKYFIDDLISECEMVLLENNSKSDGISRRQIFDDINFMESDAGWSIELDRIKEGRKVYYRYKDTSFSINNMPLNELEIIQLKDALNILSQFKGMPQFEWVNEMIPKLQQGMNNDTPFDAIMNFDNNNYLKGIENLGLIYNAIYYKKTLKIDYKPFENNDPYEIMIHPYFLKQFNNRWFLFGYNKDADKYDWNLALDRIEGISECEVEFHNNNLIDWNDYFDDIIGVTKPDNGKIENIVLEFNGRTTNYVKNKPIHGSQKSKWLDSNILEVRIDVIINYEIEHLILSYADNVKVIKPLYLKERIIDRLKTAVTNYH